MAVGPGLLAVGGGGAQEPLALVRPTPCGARWLLALAHRPTTAILLSSCGARPKLVTRNAPKYFLNVFVQAKIYIYFKFFFKFSFFKREMG